MCTQHGRVHPPLGKYIYKRNYQLYILYLLTFLDQANI